MKIKNWSRRDIGDNTLVAMKTPITENETVLVEIPFAAYKQLVCWASMARTLEAIQNSLPEGDQTIAEEELDALTPAIVAIHLAIRNHAKQGDISL